MITKEMIAAKMTRLSFLIDVLVTSKFIRLDICCRLGNEYQVNTRFGVESVLFNFSNNKLVC